MDMDMDMDMDVDMDMDMDIDVYHRPNLELACNVGSRLLIHFSPLLSNITVTLTVTAGIKYYRCNVLYSTVLYCTILYRPIHRYAFS